MLWSLLGFLGRYGHQPVMPLLELSVQELGTFARQVSEFMEEENRQAENPE